MSEPQTTPQATAHKTGRFWTVAGVLVGLAALVIGWFAWLNPDPVGQPSTREDRLSYIEQVDASCAEYLEFFATLALDGEVSSSEDLVRIIDDMRSSAQALDHLWRTWQSIAPPRDADYSILRPTLDALESMRMSTDSVTDYLQRGLSGGAIDQAVLASELEQMTQHATDFRRLAREYGFAICPQLGA
ncbi:hypothetical protein [Agromyces luteolus]|uniref:Uncharacterized protein n=1 Tax=Agromyces luteolus TaxID=88373 RepID=A0A7C9LH09_9MICO|nr:hypothetical protein [Agromyces luteolus]MUN06914.1 hypothetical protein [Agromyces luteolus]